MKLEKYLKAIEKCPDEEIKIGESTKNHRLTYEFGVYDNFAIFLKTDIKELLKYLNDSGKFVVGPMETYDKRRIHPSTYKPNGVILQVIDCLYYSKGIEKILKEGSYNLTIMLHPADKDYNPVSWAKTIKPVIKEIGEYIKKNNVPACLQASGDSKQELIFH